MGCIHKWTFEELEQMLIGVRRNVDHFETGQESEGGSEDESDQF